MIFYKEIKKGRKSIFKKIITDENGKIISYREVDIPLYIVKKDDKTWFLLYNDNMKILLQPTIYLNFMMQEKSLKTKRTSAAALRILYIFLSLSNFELNSLGQEQLNELIRFLQGLNSNPEEFKTVTTRSNQTVNNYLGIYREYFRKQSIHCPCIFDGKTTKEQTFFSNDAEVLVTRIKYANNLNASNPHVHSVPKYISPSDFEKLYNLAINKNDKLAMCIMRLMYCYGLRLGEVLGLTIEDIKESYIENRLVPSLILRNRLSDKEYQYAKNLRHVESEIQYHSTEYIKSNSVIIIDYDLFELIYDYINEEHSRASAAHPSQYKKSTADIVSYKDAPESNHYIFLSSRGNILSAQVWGIKLKNYFNQCKIAVDYNYRENNLSHRFRHGFAMLHAHYRKQPVNALELQKMMRHHSLSSTMIYYNLTEDEEFDIKEEFVNELFELIPNLKKGDDYFGHKN